MLGNINKDTRRNLIVAIYVLIAIIFTGFIPFIKPEGLLLTICGLLITLSLFEVWTYQPIGKTKPIFWGVFILLVGIAAYSFKLIPIKVSNILISAILGIIALIIGLKDWM